MCTHIFNPSFYILPSCPLISFITWLLVNCFHPNKLLMWHPIEDFSIRFSTRLKRLKRLQWMLSGGKGKHITVPESSVAIPSDYMRRNSVSFCDWWVTRWYITCLLGIKLIIMPVLDFDASLWPLIWFITLPFPPICVVSIYLTLRLSILQLKLDKDCLISFATFHF